MPLTVVVVPHTHWDREWYLPFEAYRHRLVRLIDALLSRIDADPFVLDGQSIVLEDYLELRPERRDDPQWQVRGGTLAVGPWYVLPDEFLVSGEALVRNLAEGRRVARSLGWDTRRDVGYSPDPFGHVAQLPQILRGLGMDIAIFARGLGDQPTRTVYRWRAPDGSEVLGALLATSYSNGRLMPDDETQAAIRLAHEVERLRPFLAAPVALICAGSDHEHPSGSLRSAAKAASPDGTRFQLGTFATYADALRDHEPPAEVLEGELRGARLLPLLPGVLSARIPLKQANDRCQDLLERVAEPLAAVAARLGGPDPRPSLRHAWRLLLQNQAHDSICGCSIDAVHRENMVRFERAEQAAREVAREALETISSAVVLPSGERCVVVANTLPWPRSEVVELVVNEALAAGWREGVKRKAAPWQAYDSLGEPLATQMLSETFGEATFPHPGERAASRARVAVRRSVPALGVATLTLKRADEAAAGGTMRWGEGWVANDFHRVSPTARGLRIAERALDLWLESERDRGDTYNFSAADLPARGFLGNATMLGSGPLVASLGCDLALETPAGLDPEREPLAETARSSVRLRATLRAACPWIELRLRVDNRARDHRLRLLIGLEGEPSESWAEGAFHVSRRPATPSCGEGWIEDPASTHPHRGFVFIPDREDASRGLIVLARGLPEYELVPARDGLPPALALTLLRSVGWLSREDVPERRCQAGPKIPVPEAQCPGTHDFRIGVMPWSGDGPPGPSELFRLSQPFAAPLQAHDASAPVPFGQESWPSAQAKVPLDASRDLVRVVEGTAVLTAIKPGDESGALTLRLFNASDAPTVAVVAVALPDIGWPRCVDLEERPLDLPRPSWENRHLRLPLEPWRIATVRFGG